MCKRELQVIATGVLGTQRLQAWDQKLKANNVFIPYKLMGRESLAAVRQLAFSVCTLGDTAG